MRTTFTASPDVAERLREISKRTQRSMSQVVNDLLRQAIGAQYAPVAKTRFVVEPRKMGLRDGLDPERLSELLAEMEASDVDRSRH